MAHAQGDVALISFTLTDTSDDSIIESVPPTSPIAVLTGVGTLPQPLEAAIEGLEAGASFDVAVDEPYGKKTGREQAVKKAELPKQVRERLRPGLAFQAGGSDDNSVVLYVQAIKGSRVTLTVDHPLAGKSLRFAGQLHVSRPATDSERAHGHAHGSGGHRH